MPRLDIAIPSLALTQIDDEESENQVRCRQNRLLWVQGHLAEVQKSLCFVVGFCRKIPANVNKNKQPDFRFGFRASAWKHVFEIFK